MYVGHAAVALALRSKYPGVAILPLALACYGPDLVEAVLMFPAPRAAMGVYTHSIPALVIGALVAAGTYALFTRNRADAFAIFAGWMLHWPADFFTGLKPILGLDTRVGLDLYHLPAADYALESLCVVAACAVYARRFAPSRRERRVVVALGCALLVLHAALLWIMTEIEPAGWNPSLALDGSQTHLGSDRRIEAVAIASVGSVRAHCVPHASCTTSPRPSTASGEWMHMATRTW